MFVSVFMTFNDFLQCFIADRSVSSAPTVQWAAKVLRAAAENYVF
jgi:hypothetical protein